MYLFRIEDDIGLYGKPPWWNIITDMQLPAFLMLIFFIGTVVSLWLALDPIQQIRKLKYLPITLICFIGFLLAGLWDMNY